MPKKHDSPEDVAKARGFDSWAEMGDLVGAADRLPRMARRLEAWKESNGTKAELLKLVGGALGDVGSN